MKELKFIKITSPDIFRLIPKHLFEQIGGRSWQVDRLLKMNPLSLISGCNYFWVLVNNDSEVKGILWAVIDVLSEKLNVIAFEIDEEYQCESDIEMALQFLRSAIKEFNLLDSGTVLKDKINWVTNDPEKFKQFGGAMPETVLIEI